MVQQSQSRRAQMHCTVQRVQQMILSRLVLVTACGTWWSAGFSKEGDKEEEGGRGLLSARFSFIFSTF